MRARGWLGLWLMAMVAHASAFTRLERVVVGLDDLARTGQYAGIRILVRHDGAETLRATLRADCRGDRGESLGSVARDIDLPPKSRKQFVLPLIVVDRTTAVEVSVRAGRRRVALQRVRPLTIAAEVKTLYVLGEDFAPRDAKGEHLTLAQAGSSYGRYGGRNQPAVVRVRELADWSALPASRHLWQGVDNLSVNGAPPSSFSAEQQLALAEWLTAGGSILVATSDLGALRRSFLAKLLPVTLTGNLTRAPLRDLALLTGDLRDGDAWLPIAEARLKPKEAVVVAGTRQRPLVARRKHGLGGVTWLAFDPAKEPIASWRGQLDCWKTLVRWYQGDGDESTASIDADNLTALVREARVVNTPSRTAFLAPLVGYAVALVLVAIIVAKIVRRKEWTWLALVAVSGAFALLYCVPLRRLIKGQRYLAGVTIRYLMPGEEHEYQNVEATLFSPLRQRVELRARVPEMQLETGDGEFDRHVVLSDDATRVQEEASPWSLLQFSGRHTAPRTGRLGATVRRVDDDWHYRIVNRLPFTLRHGRLRLIHPELLIERALPPLPPNVPVNVTLTPTGAKRRSGRHDGERNVQLGVFSPKLKPAERERRIRAWLIAKAHEGMDLDPYARDGFGTALVAFADRSPFVVNAPGFRAEWRHLVVTALPGVHPKLREQLKPSEDATAQWHEAVLLRATARVETDNELNATLVHPGEAVFEYPLELHPSKLKRKLHVGTEGKLVRGAQATLAVYNWRKGAWTEQKQKFGEGKSNVFSLDHVHPTSGRVWAKLTVRGGKRSHLQLQNMSVVVGVDPWVSGTPGGR